jgi:hypothetical protein
MPLHMWTPAVAEELLAPYSALEYIDLETRTHEDPSGFKCLVRAQRLLHIPDSIIIKTPAHVGLLAENQPTSLLLDTYRVHIDKTEYLHGITRTYEYDSAPTTNTSHIVYPHQCYISPRLHDIAAIEKYSAAVVIHAEPDNHFATMSNLCDYLRGYIHPRIRIKLLKEGTYIIYFNQHQETTSLHSLLENHLRYWINRGGLYLTQWTPSHGSIPETISEKVHLKIRGIPCNLNVPPVIEYTMSPFAYVDAHFTESGDSYTSLRKTITLYECSAWCSQSNRIPATIRIKVILEHITDLTQVSHDETFRCPEVQISVLPKAIAEE